MRTISWFSCGAASAVAAKLSPGSVLAYCYVANEHPDNLRFLKDCEKWIGTEILVLKSEKYADCWQVWEERRYLNGPAGALCTVEMKKKVRQKFSQPDDIHVFGFTVEEMHRAERFCRNNPEIEARFPLIQHGLGKGDCYDIIRDAGIALPAMYKLGYHNANCVGCVKGGSGYWNKIRRDFPAVFERMAAIEESIGASCMNGKPLRTLDPNAGTEDELQLDECGLFCGENSRFAEWAVSQEEVDA